MSQPLLAKTPCVPISKKKKKLTLPSRVPPTESNAKASNIARERNDTGKKGNASSSGCEPSKRPSMDGLALDHEAKEAAGPEKSTADGKDGEQYVKAGITLRN